MYQVTIGTTDISLDDITCTVELIESGIASCTLMANNLQSKNFLSTVAIGSIVTCKGTPDTGNFPITVSWSSIIPFFVGFIQEVKPVVDKSGQRLAAVALGVGYQLKLMRAAEEYGYIYPIINAAMCYGFDGTVQQWGIGGSLPYLQNYSWWRDIIISPISSNYGKQIGSFSFGMPIEYQGGQFNNTVNWIGQGPNTVTDTVGDTSSTMSPTTDILYAFPISPSQTGTLHSIGINIATAYNGNVVVAIYGGVSGVLTGLLAYSTAYATTSTGWLDIPVGDVTLTQGLVYYIAIEADNSSVGFYYKASSGSTTFYSSSTVTPFGDFPASVTMTNMSNMFNMRIKYSQANTISSSGILLNFVCGITNASSGKYGTFLVEYTTDPVTISNPTWYSFTNVPVNMKNGLTAQSTASQFVVSANLDANYVVGNYGYFTPYAGVYRPLCNYDPMIDMFNSYAPPEGQIISLDISPDLPYWNNNFRIRITLVGSSGTGSTDILAIGTCWLYYYFNGMNGKTVRQLIAGDNGCLGLINNFVNNAFMQGAGQSLVATPTNPNQLINVGYTPLGTDYVVYDNPSNTNVLIPYMKFPYEDCMNALQDIVKFGSALQFLQQNNGWQGGYHWKFDILGNLLIAPTINHHVQGKDSSHYVDSVPNTNGWVLQPYPNKPIVIANNLVSQSFKKEIPIYNYIVVAGKFQFPLNDDIVRGRNNSSWIQGQIQSGGNMTFTGFTPANIYHNVIENGVYIGPYMEYSIAYGGGNLTGVEYIALYPLVDFQGNNINLTQLMGFDTVPYFSFWFKNGGYTSSFKLYLFLEALDSNNNPTGQPNGNAWYECPFTNPSPTDTWGYIEIDLPNVKQLKDWGSWKINTTGLGVLGGFGLKSAANIDWLDMAGVLPNNPTTRRKMWFGIGVDFTQTPPWSGNLTYIRIMHFQLNGVVLRAAYDSANIAQYGCRMLTIKDSFCQTDSLNPNDDMTPLGLEAIYQLQRYRRSITTGTVVIPFDPTWQEGQQVWIQTEQQANGNYQYNQWFRITKVTHTLSIQGAFTQLTITDDLVSSLPIDTTNVYTVRMRETSPDFQSKDFGSLKSKDDFELGLPILAKDYAGYSL